MVCMRVRVVHHASVVIVCSIALATAARESRGQSAAPLSLLGASALGVVARAGQVPGTPAPGGPGSGAAVPDARPGQPPPPVSAPDGRPRAPARDRGLAKGTATLRGTVRAADTGAPLRRVTVQVLARGGGSRSVITDGNGAYDLPDLPAGRYTVLATKVGLVSMSYGERRPQTGGRAVTVADGQVVERIDIMLPRGGVITGRVLDELGEPMPEASVVPQRRLFGIDGQPRNVPVGRNAMTNDAGEFRLYGLTPGDYYLSASVRAIPGPDSVGSGSRDGFAPTYYPGVADSSSAQRLRVRVGETLSDITISLVPTRLARVSGTAVDAGGKPLERGMVLAVSQQGPGGGMPTGTGSIGADGTFAVDGLSPGAYVLRANPRGFSAPGSSSESEWPSIAEVIVAGEDLTGIRLAPLAPIRLAGTISFAGAPQPMPPRQGMRVRLVAVSPLPVLGAAPSAMPQEDGSFMLSAMPGRFLVRPTLDPLGTTGEPSPWVLRSVRLNGADVTDTGIELAAGADVQGLEVEMTNLRTEVVGAVTDQRGVRLIEYAVVIFSRDRERWGGGRHLAIARPEEEGRFRVRTLAPADYEAVALDSVGTNLLQDREFVESLRGAGTTFTLGEGESKQLELRLSAIAP